MKRSLPGLFTIALVVVLVLLLPQPAVAQEAVPSMIDRPESVVWLAVSTFDNPEGDPVASPAPSFLLTPDARLQENPSAGRVALGGAIGWSVAALVAGGGGHYLDRHEELRLLGVYGLLFAAPIGTAIGTNLANDGQGSGLLAGLASFLGGAVGGIAFLAADEAASLPIVLLPATLLVTQVSSGVLLQRATAR